MPSWLRSSAEKKSDLARKQGTALLNQAIALYGECDKALEEATALNASSSEGSSAPAEKVFKLWQQGAILRAEKEKYERLFELRNKNICSAERAELEQHLLGPELQDEKLQKKVGKEKKRK